MATSHYEEFQEQLLRSLHFFWPLDFLNLLVVLDEELDTRSLQEGLRQEAKQFQSFHIRFNKPTAFYRGNGHDRQQLIMFWADNFTESEYVGFVDTDTFFVTPVYREDLFEEGKPVIVAFHSLEFLPFWGKASWATKRALGMDEEFRCMSYFPVIVKTKHLPGLRQFVEDRHGTTFNDYFMSSLGLRSVYSQFNIMCNYLWHHHQDEYAWHVQLIGEKVEITPDSQAQAEAKYGASLLYPKPRVAIHTNYHHLKGPARALSGLMALGYCYDGQARQVEEQLEWCRNHSVTLRGFNEHMFHFEEQDWRYDVHVGESFQLRQKWVAKCARRHAWDRNELETMSSDLSDGENIFLVS